MRQRWLAVVLLGVLLGTTRAQAVPDRLLQVVPADPLAVIWFDRHAAEDGEEPVNAGRIAAAILQHTREMGLLRDVDATVGLLADVLALQPELGRYPRAVVVLDVQADPLSGGGFRLGGLGAGLIVVTGGDHLRIERQIQALLNLHADRETARLTQRDANGMTVYTLADRRWPEWAVVEWGAVQDCYLITLGAGVFDRLASSVKDPHKGLAAEAWFGQAHQRCRGPAARWEWYLDFQAVLARLVPAMGDQPRKVLAALGLGDVARGLWTVGLVGRTVDAACVLDVAGREHYLPISLTGEAARPFDPLIPPTEPNGTILDARPREMVPRACRAYLAARSPYVRERLTERWAALEAELGIHAETDILDHLGRHAILHNFPQHPLRLPVFVTIMIEIENSPDTVRTALDRLLRRAQEYLTSPSEQPGLLRLNRDADGVWYLQYGIYGPALVVTDRWIVLSYSPQAVRQNVQYLQGLNRDAPTRPVPQP